MKNLLLIALLALVVIAGCMDKKETVSPSPVSVSGSSLNTTELKKFTSTQELREFLLKSETTQMGGFGVRRDGDFATDAVAAPMAGGSAGMAVKQESATSYSGTNVQIQGVDEADIVKNDGKYIYVLTGSKLVIVEAFPAESGKIVSQIEFKGTPRNLFIKDNKLVVFVDGNEEIYKIMEGDFIPRPYWSQQSQAFVFDISDKSTPKKVQNYSVEGYYSESRMIGSDIYFVVNNPVNYYTLDLPLIKGSRIMAPEVFYFDRPDYGYNFQTVASINIDEGPESLNAKTFMMGYSTTMFVSENAIYLASQNNYGWGYYGGETQLDRFYKAVLPQLPAGTRSRIESLSTDQKANWNSIAGILEDMYNSMSEQEKKDQIEKIENALEEYERNIQLELSKTTIHKIAINNGNIDYSGKGEVSGRLLNQFSMDENDGNLRVATTTEFWTNKGSTMHNNVYVLNSAMSVIGKLENVAKDERIYSTRFIGDKLYMVTFQRIDPLFVIDLSEPTNPRILGELKIPGYSDYLHPYDENHIIGIGKDTKDTEWGGVTTVGIKLALFDVSDVANPKQVAHFHIGQEGTDSEALHDHKAFLFDKEKNILVIPVQEIRKSPSYDPRFGYYRQNVWQGAYVLGLTPSAGFTEKAKIQHYEGEEQQDWWYQGPNAIRRSLYMDDVLYTISSKKIKANSLSDFKEIKSIDLPYEVWYPQPMPVDDIRVISGGGSAPSSGAPGIAIAEPAIADVPPK